MLPARPQPTYSPYAARLGTPVSPFLPKVSSPVSLCDGKEVIVVDSSDVSPSEAELDQSGFVTVDLDDGDDGHRITKSLTIDEFPRAIQVTSSDQLVVKNPSSVEPLIFPVKHPPSSVAENEDIADQGDDGLADLTVPLESLMTDGVKSESSLFGSSSTAVDLVQDSTIITPDKDPTAPFAPSSSSLSPVAQNTSSQEEFSPATVDDDPSLNDTSALNLPDRMEQFLDTSMAVEPSRTVQPSASSTSSKDDSAASATSSSASAHTGTHSKPNRSSSLKSVTNLTRKNSAANRAGRLVKSKSVGVLAVLSVFPSSFSKSKSVKENLQHFRDAARAQKPRWV